MIRERSEAAGHPGLSEQERINRLRNHSERIGEHAVDAHARAHNLESVYEGSGPRTFDRVYKQGEYRYVFEGKGGNSHLGGKELQMSNPATRNLHVAQQGSREYLEQTINEMLSSPDDLRRAAGEDLYRALQNDKIRYISVQQKLDHGAEVTEAIVRQFDIR
jgi:hypothetical protein